MRAGPVAVALAVLVAGCLGARDPAPGPPNPFPGEFGLRLGCLHPAAEITDCTLKVAPGPANEVVLAVNPLDPGNLVGGSKDYGLGEGPECGGLRVWSGVYVSMDGGATWEHSYFRGHPGAPEGPLSGFPCVSDPVVVFDADGAVYYSGLAARGPPLDPASPTPQRGSALWVARSDDGGRTWGDPVFVATSDGDVVFHDKQWLAAGNGTLILTWTAFTLSSSPLPVDAPLPLASAQVLFSVSNDRGATWSPARALAEADIRQPLTPHALETDKQFTSPAFDGDGNVYVTWLGFREDLVYFAKASPGPQGTFSFSAARAIMPVIPLPPTLPNTEFRTHTYPVLAADPGTPGVLVLVWADHGAGDADIMFSRSSDGGNTWSAPRLLGSDRSTHDQWMPAVAVDTRGGVHVVWFDRREDPANRLIDLFYGYAPDGENFLAPVRVTPRSFDGDLGLHQSGVPFIGDYIGLAVASTERGFHVFPFWPDTRDGQSEVHTARLEVRVGRPGRV